MLLIALEKGVSKYNLNLPEIMLSEQQLQRTIAAHTTFKSKIKVEARGSLPD